MNFQFLMNMRPSIEDGLRGWFSDQLISSFTRQNAPESFQTVRPRVEILCKIGSATGHRKIIDGAYYRDTYNMDLALRVVTEPQNTEGNNTAYDQFVSLIRGMMQTFAQATWVDTVNFPYHLIVEPLADNSTDDKLKTDDNEEFAILTFSGIVQIRTSAWSNT